MKGNESGNFGPQPFLICCKRFFSSILIWISKQNFPCSQLNVKINKQMTQHSIKYDINRDLNHPFLCLNILPGSPQLGPLTLVACYLAVKKTFSRVSRTWISLVCLIWLLILHIFESQDIQDLCIFIKARSWVHCGIE